METTVVNMYGGPGSGKSTVAAGVFFILKASNKNVELATEFAKDLVWEERDKTLEDQQYVWAKQRHKIQRVLGKVDLVITDSPLLLSTIYGKTSKIFKECVVHEDKAYQQLNYFLVREKPYIKSGRKQSELEAKKLDEEIHAMLVGAECKFKEVDGNEMVKARTIATDVLTRVYGETF